MFPPSQDFRNPDSTFHCIAAMNAKQTHRLVSRLASSLPTTKAPGDISSIFPSLSGKPPTPLGPRFQALKAQLVKGRERSIEQSWYRLLASLKVEIETINEQASTVIWLQSTI